MHAETELVFNGDGIACHIETPLAATRQPERREPDEPMDEISKLAYEFAVDLVVIGHHRGSVHALVHLRESRSAARPGEL